jgi:hypothetical protein
VQGERAEKGEEDGGSTGEGERGSTGEGVTWRLGDLMTKMNIEHRVTWQWLPVERESASSG